MNNYHKIFSLHSVSPLKYEGGFFPQKKFFIDGKTFFSTCVGGSYSTWRTKHQIHAK